MDSDTSLWSTRRRWRRRRRTSPTLQLIRGSIDQVDATCRVEWVQPRVLQTEQIQLMSDRLQTWCGTVDKTLSFLENETPEFSS